MPMSQTNQVQDVVIVGGGPRAVSTIERLDAHLEAAHLEVAFSDLPVTVTIIDAVEIGAGATWRTDQTKQFLNNTTSNATTIYPDASTPISGPLREGPTFVDWAKAIADRGSHEIPWVVEEAREVTPGSFPTRRLQGVYYNEQLAALEAAGRVLITRAIGLAVDVTRDTGTDGNSTDLRMVHLADGSVIHARTVILAQGMVQATPDSAIIRAQTAADTHGLLYISPGMPAEKPWSKVPSGAPTIVQGLGANFFDVVSELTEGRGGSFEPVPGDATGRLRYVASGNEPQLYASSRRGVTYRSKGDFGDEKPLAYTPVFATPELFAEHTVGEPASLDFARDLWPFIAADMANAWVTAEHARRPERFDLTPAEIEVLLGAAIRADQHAFTTRSWPGAVPHIDRVLLDHVREEPSQRFSVFTVDSLRRPTRGERVTETEWQAFLDWWITDELDSLTNPVTSPKQRVNLAMGALRGRVSRLALTGVITAESVVRDVHGWFNADGLFLASGPPASRVREVLALIESGVVTLLGPETRVTIDDTDRVFRAESAVTDRRIDAHAFVETRMSKGKVPVTNDPLLRALLDRGDARTHTLSDPSGTYETESMEALPREHAELPLSLVNVEGEPDPHVLVLGIPAQSTQPGSAIGATPGVPSPLIAGADRAAARVLANRARALVQGASVAG